MVTFRKSKDGRWVAFGPASEVSLGTVSITKRDGSRTLRIVESVGRPFDVRGVAHVYGYLAADREARKEAYYASQGRCRDCGGPIQNAPHCQAHSGWCGGCAFDNE